MSDNIVEDYGWNNEPVEPESCGFVAPAIIDFFKKYNIQRAIDVGAGNGALCSNLKSALPDLYIAGVEYDAAGVKIARQHYPMVNFYNQGVQDDPTSILEMERERFDAVVSTEVIEHLFSPHLLPIYARKLIKPNGYLIVTTPYHGYIKNLALSLTGMWDKHHNPLWHGGHIKFWSRKTLTQLLEKNGFDVIDFGGVGRMHYLWRSMVLVARARG